MKLRSLAPSLYLYYEYIVAKVVKNKACPMYTYTPRTIRHTNHYHLFTVPKNFCVLSITCGLRICCFVLCYIKCLGSARNRGEEGLRSLVNRESKLLLQKAITQPINCNTLVVVSILYGRVTKKSDAVDF